MSKNIWLQKKPQSVLDWLGIIFCSIGFYILLGHLNLFVGAVGKVLNILAPFATGIVIAYVLDCIVRPVHHKLLKDNPKMRWLAILIAYGGRAHHFCAGLDGHPAGDFQHCDFV